MGVGGNTELGATKSDIISTLVLKELAVNAGKILAHVTDVSPFAIKGAKSISFPKFGSFTVEERASATQGTIQSLAASTEKMDLNIPAYVSWLYDSNDLYQSSVEGQQLFIERATKAHARYVEQKLIAAILASAGFDTGLTTITRDAVLDMIEFVEKNDGNLENCVLAISPTQRKEMLKIQEFTRADIYGSSNVPMGTIGYVYGVPVITSNSLTASQAALWDKDAVTIGFQKGAAFGEQDKLEYGVGSKLAAIDMLYGVKTLFIGDKGVAPTKSALIASL